MASAVKHKQRSSRKHQFNSIPVAQFYAHAQKVAEKKFYMSDNNNCMLNR